MQYFTTRLKGTFLIPVGEAQEHKLKTKDTFTAEQSKGLQKPTSYENEKSVAIKDTLEVEPPAGKFEQAGIGSSEEVTFEEEAEFLGFERYEYVNSSGGEVSNKGITTEGGTTTLRSVGINVKCKKNQGTGEVLGQSRLKKVAITYEGCEETINKCAVKSIGAVAGTVVTKDLIGELGEIEGTFEDDPGLDLQPESGTTVMSMETTGAGCGVTLTLAVKGDVLGIVEPKDKLQEKIEAVFKASGEKQEWKFIYEEGSGGTRDRGDELTINGAETGLTSREVLTFKEQVKVLTR